MHIKNITPEKAAEDLGSGRNPGRIKKYTELPEVFFQNFTGAWIHCKPLYLSWYVATSTTAVLHMVVEKSLLIAKE